MKPTHCVNANPLELICPLATPILAKLIWLNCALNEQNDHRLSNQKQKSKNFEEHNFSNFSESSGSSIFISAAFPITQVPSKTRLRSEFPPARKVAKVIFALQKWWTKQILNILCIYIYKLYMCVYACVRVICFIFKYTLYTVCIYIYIHISCAKAALPEVHWWEDVRTNLEGHCIASRKSKESGSKRSFCPVQLRDTSSCACVDTRLLHCGIIRFHDHHNKFPHWHYRKIWSRTSQFGKQKVSPTAQHEVLETNLALSDTVTPPRNSLEPRQRHHLFPWLYQLHKMTQVIPGEELHLPSESLPQRTGGKGSRPALIY